MRKLSLLFVLLWTWSGAALADPKADWTLVPGVRAGAITSRVTEEQLIKRFGKDQVGREEYRVAPDGEPQTVTVLWPKDEMHKLRIAWTEDKPFTKLDLIIVEGAKSAWSLPEGISLGTTLARLEKLNGKPFKINGFGWDYGGGCDFSGGALEKKLASRRGNGRAALILGDGDRVKLTDAEQEAISGEKTLTTSLPAVRKFGPIVNRIILTF